MFLVICSVFRMTSSVLGRMGLGAVEGSAISGIEPSPCHTILLCLPFLLDLWTIQKRLMQQVLISCFSASRNHCRAFAEHKSRLLLCVPLSCLAGDSW